MLDLSINDSSMAMNEFCLSSLDEKDSLCCFGQYVCAPEGQVISLPEAMKQYVEKMEGNGGRFSSRSRGKDWFVLSGTIGAIVFHTKVIVNGGSVKTMEVTYPVCDKERMAPEVEELLSSFKTAA